MENHKKREAKVYISAARKAGGKTYQTMKMVESFVKGDMSVGRKPKKVLILDVNNEYPYKKISCDIDTIQKFRLTTNIEARRITPFKPNGEVKTRQEIASDLDILIKYYYNGVLVLEDLTLIVGDAVSSDLVGSLSTNRHRTLDVIINFQTIAKVSNPKFNSVKNILRLHKTDDVSTRSTVRKNFGEDSFKKIRIAELIIYKKWLFGITKCKELEKAGRIDGDKEYDYYNNKFVRHFVHIDFDEGKMYGDFTLEEFKAACIRFLQAEKRTELTPLLEEKDINTEKNLYTLKTATEERMKELILLYGNRQ